MTNQLDRPAKQTSWTDQLYRPAGWISSFYLKPTSARIFKDFALSLYIVAASESDEGLVFVRYVGHQKIIWDYKGGKWVLLTLTHKRGINASVHIPLHAHTHIYASCTRVCAQILMIFFGLHLLTILKFKEDPGILC